MFRHKVCCKQGADNTRGYNYILYLISQVLCHIAKSLLTVSLFRIQNRIVFPYFDCNFLYILLVVPPASKELLKDFPGVKTIEVTAKYPIAESKLNIQ